MNQVGGSSSDSGANGEIALRDEAEPESGEHDGEQQQGEQGAQKVPATDGAWRDPGGLCFTQYRLDARGAKHASGRAPPIVWARVAAPSPRSGGGSAEG